MSEQILIGVDEVGRGCLAGPVVAASAAFYSSYENSEIKDSKQLSLKKREKLDQEIKRSCLAFSIVAVGARRIDNINIRQASLLAMKLSTERVLSSLATKGFRASEVLIDGNVRIDFEVPSQCIIGGDSKVLCISAASILAKVYRDSMMQRLSARFSVYGFDVNVGYPTKGHKEAICASGPSYLHRRTFRGVKEFCEGSV